MPPVEPLVLGTSVRLSARKRVDLLIEAAAELQQQGTAVRVQIVGDGPERTRLEQLAARRRVDVDFLGPLYEPGGIADFYRSVHMTVLPGHAGLTVLQSLMHGRPVVTHDDADQHAAEWEALEAGVTGAFSRGATALAWRRSGTSPTGSEPETHAYDRCAGWHTCRSGRRPPTPAGSSKLPATLPPTDRNRTRADQN
ncbi:MAG: glycosyltransferase family 4 protein [Actinobacteria bacterium]|nr:glycosyltransferase family 4 protein [Actinomycetota bacterium]